MAYSLLVNDVVQVRTKARLFGQVIRTVVHYRVSSVSAQNNAETELNALITGVTGPGLGWFLQLLDCQVAAVHYEEIAAQVVYVTRRPPVVQITNLSGTAAGVASAANIAAVLLKKTEIATARKLKNGVGGTGGMHIAGVPNTETVDGMLTLGYTTGKMALLCNRLMGNITTAANTTFVPCLWHPKGQQFHSNDLTNVVPKNEVRIMHRRTIPLGE